MNEQPIPEAILEKVGPENLVWNGRLLADHYVSKGRFKNILRKEILDQKG